MLNQKNPRYQQFSDYNCSSYKIKEVTNEIPDLSDLFKTIDYDAKMSEIEGKYFTISEYNKFTFDILDAKIKQNELSTNLIFLISSKILT